MAEIRQRQFDAHRDRFEIRPGSFADLVLRRMERGEFVEQEHEDFKACGYVVPKGGLCGPTLLLNFLAAILPKLPERHVWRTERLGIVAGMREVLTDLEGLMETDPRMGTDRSVLHDYLERLMEREEVPRMFKLKEYYRTSRVDSLSLEGDEVRLLAVQTDSTPHWLMALATRGPEILLIDPNESWRPIVGRVVKRRFVGLASALLSRNYGLRALPVGEQVLIRESAGAELTETMHERYRR